MSEASIISVKREPRSSAEGERGQEGGYLRRVWKFAVIIGESKWTGKHSGLPGSTAAHLRMLVMNTMASKLVCPVTSSGRARLSWSCPEESSGGLIKERREKAEESKDLVCST